ncbi:thiaminase II [Longibacter salinarum]|uniref:Aminopyrimidine aminohydrolase n=1 Tax=Longibacter salinarum TaxID=1850348 RepID=A0A2A8D1T9_9BACT|nr:thiaminase II [Longibacter salinarum]PEN14850.1 thiaminase II [Longibacter salinarum]
MESPTLTENRPYTVPPFAKECLEAAGEAWHAAHDHAFVQALADGSLDSDRFRFYQMQDARYLEAFADATSIISTRCTDPDDKLWFIEAAQMAVVVEQELHAGYGEELGYDADDVAQLELTPNNRAYQNHMIASAHTGSLVEAVAAITPCPWLYVDLGQQLEAEMGEVPESHPYAEWLEMYRDPAFNEYMDHLLERLHRFAVAADPAARERAKELFVLSVRYEWMFWDQSWTKQEWPV